MESKPCTVSLTVLMQLHLLVEVKDKPFFVGGEAPNERGNLDFCLTDRGSLSMCWRRFGAASRPTKSTGVAASPESGRPFEFGLRDPVRAVISRLSEVSHG